MGINVSGLMFDAKKAIKNLKRIIIMVSRCLVLAFLGVLMLSCKTRQVVSEPVKPKPKAEVKKVEPLTIDTVVQRTPISGTINFLLLLPADLAEVFDVDTLSSDSGIVQREYSKNLIEALNFYEGALLAVDSLRKAGYDVKLKVVDLPADEERQTTKVWIQKYENINLVFSMLRGKPLKTLSGILTTKKIPLISCAVNSCSVVEKNPMAICVQPSSLTQCAMVGVYARDRFKGDNIIIITGTNEKEKERSDAFLSAFTDTLARARMRKVNFSADGVAGLTKSLSLAYTNTLYVPSTDEDFVTALYSALETFDGKYRFRVIGLPVWQLFETIDPRMLEKYNTILFASEYYSYDDDAVVQFRTDFRHQFGTEPGDEAYLAYDSFLQFGKLYINRQLPIDVPETKFQGLRTQYLFHDNDSIAAENQYIHIIKIENFRYVKVNREN